MQDIASCIAMADDVAMQEARLARLSAIQPSALRPHTSLLQKLQAAMSSSTAGTVGTAGATAAAAGAQAAPSTATANTASLSSSSSSSSLSTTTTTSSSATSDAPSQSPRAKRRERLRDNRRTVMLDQGINAPAGNSSQSLLPGACVVPMLM
jgi:hypothetical protein